jgi:predicted Zn-dependent peptidase
MFEKTLLDNGIRILTEQRAGTRAVSLGIWVENGSRHEERRQGGLSHFLEHILFKGTQRRSPRQIAEEMDSVGGVINAFTGKESTCYYAKSVDEHLPLAIDVLKDIFLNSVFDPDEIERERTVILQEIASADENPEDFVHDLFSRDYFGDHPLGRPISGEAETVNGFTRDDLVGFMAERYLPGRVIIAGAGNLSHAELVDAVAGEFGALPSGSLEGADVPPEIGHGLFQHPRELGQVHICLGAPGLPHGDPRHYVAHVLNTVLGGSMSSRLFQNIREKRGLAYAVSSGLTSYRDAGVVTVYVGCDGAAVAEVVDLVVEELRGLKRTPVPGDELQRAKDHLKGSCVLGLESTTSRMSHLAQCEMYFGRQVPLSETLAGIERVTADDVQRVAGDLFRDGALAATLVGPVAGETLSPAQLELG